MESNNSEFLFNKNTIKFFFIVLNRLILSINACSSGLVELEVNRNDVNTIIFLLKNDEIQFFNRFIDMVSYDHIDSSKSDRFSLNYLLKSQNELIDINIVTSVAEGSFMESITNLYDCANWSEREVFDMFGIYFFNNEKLCRILSDYGFKGHPLRKDFPMSGYIDAFYSIEQKKIGHFPIELMQCFRKFTLSNNFAVDSF